METMLILPIGRAYQDERTKKYTGRIIRLPQRPREKALHEEEVTTEYFVTDAGSQGTGSSPRRRAHRSNDRPGEAKRPQISR
jgi:hypothetical protein